MTSLIQNVRQQIAGALPVTRALQELPFLLVFKTTNYCWYECPHCCENSGPHQPRTFIPAFVIRGYVAEAERLGPAFANKVVLTGGEIMSAYRFGPENYVPDVLRAALGTNVGVDIKTNGAWARAEFGQQIIDDLTGIIAENAPYRMSISLSLDDYHPNSVQNAATIIRDIARRPDQHVSIRLSGFPQTIEPLKQQLLAALNTRRVPLCQGYIQTQNMRPVWVAGQKTILDFSTGTLFAGGRAKNLPNALASTPNESRFRFICPAGVLMAFDTTGRVTLGENSGPKIDTRWVDMGYVRPLGAIRNDLMSATRWAELKARLTGTHPMSR